VLGVGGRRKLGGLTVKGRGLLVLCHGVGYVESIEERSQEGGRRVWMRRRRGIMKLGVVGRTGGRRTEV
jgi:hypothetical protein